MTDRCAVAGCHDETEIVYLERGICGHHWIRLNDEPQAADALARALGITVAPDATEEIDMKEATETETTPGTTTPVAEATNTEKNMKGKTKTPKAAKKAKATKATAAKKEKPAKAKKVKREKPPNDATRTFAIRISDAELEAIHKAAGPRNATRLVRALTVAFVHEDEAGFMAIVEEAKGLRQ